MTVDADKIAHGGYVPIAAYDALAARLEAAESQRDAALVALNIAYTNRDARLEAAETALAQIKRLTRPGSQVNLIARAALAAGRPRGRGNPDERGTA